MHLIVGLGNPGTTYTSTRHNIGFTIVDALQKHEKAPAFKMQKKFEGLSSKIMRPSILLFKPTTFMNESGRAVAKIMQWYTIPFENLIVVHDELDLPFGRIRISQGASAGGHKGVASIIEALGSKNFTRLRIGISSEKKKNIPSEKFVLQQFTKEEKKSLPITDAQEALLVCINKNPEMAMQQFNSKK